MPALRRTASAAQRLADLGEDLGGGLTTAEVDYLVAQEWACTAADILFRRSKLGLHVPPGTPARLAAYLDRRRAANEGKGELVDPDGFEPPTSSV